MTGLPSPASAFVQAYLLAIRDRMIELFPVDRHEAEGRISRDFGSWDLEDEETENFLGHEDPDHWAKTVYYGFDVQWWLVPEKELRPRSWP